MTYDDAERYAREHTLDLAHQCDETAAECTHDERHAPGDVRCSERARHSVCSHDRETIAESKRLVHLGGTIDLGRDATDADIVEITDAIIALVEARGAVIGGEVARRS